MSIAERLLSTKAVEAVDYQPAHRFEVIRSWLSIHEGPTAFSCPLQGQTDGHDYIEQTFKQAQQPCYRTQQDVTPPDGICAI